MKRTLLLALLVGCTDAPPTDVVCGAGELVDGETCVPEACGQGPWGAHAELEAVFAVPEGADPGDGSPDAPIAGADAGIDRAFELGLNLVVLSGDTFRESISFGRNGDGMRLLGRCPEMTVIDGEGLPGAAITVHADGAQLSDLTVRGGAPGVAVVPSTGEGTARLTASGVVLEDSAFAALVVAGAGDVEADLRDVIVRRVVPRTEGAEAHALRAEGAGRLALTDVEVLDTVGIGVSAVGAGTSVELEDVRIVGTQEHPAGLPGAALLSDEGGAIHGRRVTLEDTDGAGVWSRGAGSLVDLEGSEILESAAEGARAQDGGRVALTQASVAGAEGTGLLGQGEGAQLILDDVIVRGVDAVDSARGAVGLLLTQGATASATALAIRRGDGPGLVVDAGARLDGRGCTIEDRDFAGAIVSGDATLRLTGGSIARTTAWTVLRGGVGLLVLGGPGGPTAELVGVSLADHAGPAVVVQGASTVLLSGGSIERSGSGGGDLARAGLIARDGTQPWSGTVGAPDASGLWIREVLLRDLGGDAMLFDGASGTVENNVFEDIGETAVRTQACAEPIEFVGPRPGTNDCDGPLRIVGAPLVYPGQ